MKCFTKFCRGRTYKSGRSKYCSKCRARRWKLSSPAAYAYNKLKYRAKERGHEFKLSREKFYQLWNSGLAKNHGKTATSLSINRIRNHEGYHDNNVELLTLSENSRRRYVPYFKDKATMDAAIAETSQKIKEAYPEIYAQ